MLRLDGIWHFDTRVFTLKFKKSFGNFIFKNFYSIKEIRKVNWDMSTEECKQVPFFMSFLMNLYDATLKLSSSLYMTSNYYINYIFGAGYMLSQHL